MTPEEVTERQVTRVRELTNMGEDLLPRTLILELLKSMYPTDAASYISKVTRPS